MRIEKQYSTYPVISIHPVYLVQPENYNDYLLHGVINFIIILLKSYLHRISCKCNFYFVSNLKFKYLIERLLTFFVILLYTIFLSLELVIAEYHLIQQTLHYH